MQDAMATTTPGCATPGRTPGKDLRRIAATSQASGPVIQFFAGDARRRRWLSLHCTGNKA
ncbi:hypothetical protein CTA1_5543 [Colletotrichum tanaceti]|uniref:Uncharacterized protein n=1 Tax=Colletotrichum tanaceti TaxID=1306861 RepID=A0A4U6X5G4_9PEZI|nr:hypothetical protein CTA1_5543 [Colletotrichum tanaceti]